jgi:hypothetical protein
MASFFASPIALGTSVPYHTTSRQRLADVTADALRSAAVRLPPDDLRQHGPWIVRGHFQLTADARALLPPVMGGSGRDVCYMVSSPSRAVILRAAEAGTSRRALAATLHLDSLGFASSDPLGISAAEPLGIPLGLSDLAEERPDGATAPVSDTSPSAPERRRDAGGRFVSHDEAPLSGGGSPGTALFRATTAEGDTRPSSQSSIKNILSNRDAKDAACALIAQVGGSFPHVLSKMGCGFLRARVEDFPAVVLAETAAELRSQMGVYTILRESARAAALGAGVGGAIAADCMGAAFDAEAAAAIIAGDVTVDLTLKRWS